MGGLGYTEILDFLTKFYKTLKYEILCFNTKYIKIINVTDDQFLMPYVNLKN